MSTAGGYQLLLDQDADAYGRIIPSTADVSLGTDYGDFEYMIPENANPDYAAAAWIGFNEEETIEIDPGTYDYTLAFIDSEGPIVPGYEGGGFSKGDDFYFAAGTEYVFSLVWIDGSGGPWSGLAEKTDLQIDGPVEMQMVSITAPNSWIGLAEEEITVELKNNGNTASSVFDVRYTVDGGSPVEETVRESVEPGASLLYTFTQKADLSAEGEHVIEAEVIALGDALSTNNKASKTLRNIASSLEMPIVSEFDNEDEELGIWDVLDRNGDGQTWFYEVLNDGWNGDPFSGGARIYSPHDTAHDDYLILHQPVHMDMGMYHIRFNYQGWGNSESLSVLYGPTMDVTQMETLCEINGFSQTEDMVFKASNFSIDESGEYVFAFRARSSEGNIGIDLDNIHIEEGMFFGTPDLVVEEVLLPVSACGLSESPIGVNIANMGTGDISAFTLRYTINGGDTVSEQFDSILAMGEKMTVYFSQAADFSTEGTTYVVNVDGILTMETEEETGNNAAQAEVTHQSPIELPFISDFSKEEDRQLWNFTNSSWLGAAWYYSEEDRSYRAYTGDPLYSNCVELEAGKTYTVSITYRAGYLDYIIRYPDQFQIRYGATGVDAQAWDTILESGEVYTDELHQTMEAQFVCENPGNYNFGIVPLTDNSSLYVREFSVSEVGDYDIKLNSVQGLARMIPLDQASKLWVKAEVSNRGSLEVDSILLGVDLEEENLAQLCLPLGGTGQSISSRLDFEANGMKAGDSAEFQFWTLVKGHEEEDSYPDNSLSQTIFFSDTVMAYDHAEDWMARNDDYIIGGEGINPCGIPFTIAVQDTLTGISVAWASDGQAQDITIELYAYDPETGKLGDILYTTSVYDEIAGTREYALPSLLLEPGTYMVVVTFTGFNLVSDHVEGGSLYIVYEGEVYRQNDVGYPGIRAIFGHNGKVMAKDASVEQIIEPAEEGAFSNRERIVARVRNNGFDTAVIPVHLLVNGTEASVQNVTLPPYGGKDVEFHADLSQPDAEYTILAYASLEGDEMRSNDSCTKTVRRYPEADPYVLDFEYCEDFAISGFYPAWTTVDRDASPTIGLENWFEGCTDPKAFMAFNPSMTSPASDYDFDLKPFEGKHFGGSFPAVFGPNDDWLISPKLLLPRNGAQLSLYVKSYSSVSPESYNILVSTTGNDPDDFQAVGSTRQAPDVWEEVVVNLDDYAGQEVHVAIQCVSDNAALFMVDNIRISKPTGTESRMDVSSSLSVYPNPASEKIAILCHNGAIRQVSIFNLAGAEIYASSGELDQDEFRYDASNLPSGIYFARVRTEQGTALLKFVVR